MPKYDGTLFNPPAPLGRVLIRDPVSGQTATNVPMLMDSGADVSLLPEPSLISLGITAESGDAYELTAFDGSKSVSHAVNVHVLFLQCTFRGRFLTINQPWGILGRDVLKHLSILLDGPDLWWNEQERPE